MRVRARRHEAGIVAGRLLGRSAGLPPRSCHSSQSRNGSCGPIRLPIRWMREAASQAERGDALRGGGRARGGVGALQEPPGDPVEQPVGRLFAERRLRGTRPRLRLLLQPGGDRRPGAGRLDEVAVRLDIEAGALVLPGMDQADQRLLAGRGERVSGAGHVDDRGVRAVHRPVAVRARLDAEAPQLVGDAMRAGGVVVGDVGVVLLRVVQVRLLDAAEELRAALVRTGRARDPEPVDDDAAQRSGARDVRRFGLAAPQSARGRIVMLISLLARLCPASSG